MSTSNLNQSSSPTDAPWNTPWPANELERVSACPVCGSAERTVLHDGLIDNVFQVAPGKWTLHRCTQCSSAYLDPRPTPASIGRAYESYYTHTSDSDKPEYADLGRLRRLRRQLVNGYTRWRYSSNGLPACGFGVLVAAIVPGMKKRLDREYRNLPCIQGEGATLLDVGSGNGAFLSLARSCGWAVIGIDPDPEAVKTSVKNGFTVFQGGVDFFGNETEKFDVITLNHVIEHLHNPFSVLKKCFQLLKPGGQIWIETPNIESAGHSLFTSNWRGIETPRHLVLFNQRSLNSILLMVGFIEVKDMPRPNAVQSLFTASYALARGISPYTEIQLTMRERLQILRNELKENIFPKYKELVTVVAMKAK